MESKAIKCCACSKVLVPNFIKNPEIFYQSFECDECKKKNYTIKCPSCKEYTISQKSHELYPGKKIRCRYANCAAIFQYISCPMLNCRKLNYFLGDLVVGDVLPCGACKTMFQDIPCPECGIENYYRGSPEDCYNTGIPHPCRACKKTFVRLTCPHCKEPIAPNQDYRPGEKIRCENCYKTFQQTNCTACKKAKYYPQCELKAGTKENCSSCSKNYKTCVCPICSISNSTLVALGNNDTLLQELTPITCTTCRSKYEHIACPCCCMPFYVPSELRAGTSNFECFYCKVKSIHLYNCSVCRKRYCSKEQGITSCPNRCIIQQDRVDNELASTTYLSKAYSKMQLEESKESGLSSLADEKLCKICMESERNSAFLDCGHFLCCWKCSNKIMESSRKCPVCKNFIIKCQRIYVV